MAVPAPVQYALPELSWSWLAVAGGTIGAIVYATYARTSASVHLPPPFGRLDINHTHDSLEEIKGTLRLLLSRMDVMEARVLTFETSLLQVRAEVQRVLGVATLALVDSRIALNHLQLTDEALHPLRREIITQFNAHGTPSVEVRTRDL